MNVTRMKPAVFTRQEIERLTTDARIELEQRVAHALLVYAKLRAGELVALRWCDYDEEQGALNVSATYRAATDSEERPKSGSARRIGVHPRLAKLLSEFRASPDCEGPHDSILSGAGWAVHERVIERFREALMMLGLQARPLHALRMTGVRDILEVVTPASPAGRRLHRR